MYPRYLRPFLMLAALTYSSCATSPQHCAVESPQTCRMQGIQHQTGRGAPQDPLLSERYFRTGCEGGDTESCWELGLVLRDRGMAEESHSIIAKNCENDHAKSCELLGDLGGDIPSLASYIVMASIPQATLSFQEVSEVLARAAPALRDCQSSHRALGDLAITLTLDESGNVTHTELGFDQENESLFGCVRKALNALKFPPQQEKTKIRRTFRFK